MAGVSFVFRFVSSLLCLNPKDFQKLPGLISRAFGVVVINFAAHAFAPLPSNAESTQAVLLGVAVAVHRNETQ